MENMILNNKRSAELEKAFYSTCNVWGSKVVKVEITERYVHMVEADGRCTVYRWENDELRLFA